MLASEYRKIKAQKLKARKTKQLLARADQVRENLRRASVREESKAVRMEVTARKRLRAFVTSPGAIVLYALLLWAWCWYVA